MKLAEHYWSSGKIRKKDPSVFKRKILKKIHISARHRIPSSKVIYLYLILEFKNLSSEYISKINFSECKKLNK